ncbi:lipoprotein [Flavobacterium sp. 3HN19-14]
MNKSILTISAAIMLTGCNPKITKNMDTHASDDTTPKVTGVGGISFF